MSNDTDDMEDAADDYLDGEAEELDVMCPLSGLPVVDCEKAFDFAGAPEAIFWKILAKREMSAQDYVMIIKHAYVSTSPHLRKKIARGNLTF